MAKNNFKRKKKPGVVRRILPYFVIILVAAALIVAVILITSRKGNKDRQEIQTVVDVTENQNNNNNQIQSLEKDGVPEVKELVQKYFDKKDGFVVNKNDASAQEDDTTAAGVPKFYALLPLFPLVLLLLFNELVITSIKMNVVTAMMMGVCLTIILEVIRKPKHAFESVKIIDVFFGGMGKQFANIITLIMSGEIFAEGLKRMGMIDLIIEGAQNIGFGPIPMTIVMVAIIMISAIIMGSGAAPFYAFIALAPTVSESFGIHPVIMCLAMQLATGMGRNMSPISSCMVATAGCTDGKVLSVDLVKRTVIPMFVGAVGLILGYVIFFM